MSKKIDHLKVSRVAKIATRGAKVIDYDDRTLSPSGYPPAREMEWAAPGNRPQRLNEPPPRIVIQETVEEFWANVLRGEREKNEAKKELKDRRHRSATISAETKKARQIAQVESKRLDRPTRAKLAKDQGPKR